MKNIVKFLLINIIFITYCKLQTENGYAQANEWTWMKGDNGTDAFPTYGTKGISSPTNDPGSRSLSVSWTDTAGNFWLYGGSGSMATNDLWKYNVATNQWTWVNGDSSVKTHDGVWGTKGISSPSNTPGDRCGALSWTDANNNLWLFGGENSTYSNFNDLWKYNISTNQWTWVSGDNIPDQNGVYGTQGVSSPVNKPGSRWNWGVVNWTDTNGELWLLGGQGFDEAGDYDLLNDLWKYNIATNQWTWMKGDNTVNQVGIYGTKGVSSVTNTPGSRTLSISWNDRNGNLWLYGGVGYDAQTIGDGLNDLWKYNIASNQWTWVNGDSIAVAYGTGGKSMFGKKGIAAATNTPGSRIYPIGWADNCDNFWLFGGAYTAGCGGCELSDIWKYNITTNQWTWMNGDSVEAQSGVYGIMGVSSSSNKPGSRGQLVGWKDKNGNFWMFGGSGVNPYLGNLGDLWKYTVCSIVADAGKDTSICIGKTIILTASGGTFYQWNTGETTKYISVNPTATTTYRVTVSDCGCSQMDSITISVNPLDITITGDTIICQGYNTVLTASGGTSYLWNTGAITPSVTVDTSGNYQVSISDSICQKDTTIIVTVNPLPIATAKQDTTIISGSSVTLIATGGNGYLWSTGATTASISVFPITTTQYSVTVTDSNNCSDTVSVKVIVTPKEKIICGELFVPTAFSPNNDNENDELHVMIMNTSCISTLLFQVYDRWGNNVFAATDMTKGWDGTYKGKELNTSVFVYYLKATLITGETIKQRGNISLIR